MLRQYLTDAHSTSPQSLVHSHRRKFTSVSKPGVLSTRADLPHSERERSYFKNRSNRTSKKADGCRYALVLSPSSKNYGNVDLTTCSNNRGDARLRVGNPIGNLFYHRVRSKSDLSVIKLGHQECLSLFLNQL